MIDMVWHVIIRYDMTWQRHLLALCNIVLWLYHIVLCYIVPCYVFYHSVSVSKLGPWVPAAGSGDKELGLYPATRNTQPWSWNPKAQTRNPKPVICRYDSELKVKVSFRFQSMHVQNAFYVIETYGFAKLKPWESVTLSWSKGQKIICFPDQLTSTCWFLYAWVK